MSRSRKSPSRRSAQRAARDLSQRESIPYQQALDRVLQDAGASGWSLGIPGLEKVELASSSLLLLQGAAVTYIGDLLAELARQQRLGGRVVTVTAAVDDTSALGLERLIVWLRERAPRSRTEVLVVQHLADDHDEVRLRHIVAALSRLARELSIRIIYEIPLWDYSPLQEGPGVRGLQDGDLLLKSNHPVGWSFSELKDEVNLVALRVRQSGSEPWSVDVVDATNLTLDRVRKQLLSGDQEVTPLRVTEWSLRDALDQTRNGGPGRLSLLISSARRVQFGSGPLGNRPPSSRALLDLSPEGDLAAGELTPAQLRDLLRIGLPDAVDEERRAVILTAPAWLTQPNRAQQTLDELDDTLEREVVRQPSQTYANLTKYMQDFTCRLAEAEVGLDEYLRDHLGVELMSLSNSHPVRSEACCPFHDENTPSFVVQEQSGEPATWYCFGACGTGGTLIDAVMRAEGRSEPQEAVLRLAELYPDRMWPLLNLTQRIALYRRVAAAYDVELVWLTPAIAGGHSTSTDPRGSSVLESSVDNTYVLKAGGDVQRIRSRYRTLD